MEGRDGGYTPFGAVLWRFIVEAGFSQREFADAMEAEGYRGERGGLSQQTVSYILKKPNYPVSPLFFRCAIRVLGLDDDRQLELWKAYLEGAGAARPRT